ncbi:MAG TPA: hypothetical protein DG753_01080 [Clostridium sp.]|nr:hypothetical protein [Clostridium sp.]
MQNLKNIIKKPIKMSLKENLNYMTVAYLKEVAEKYEVNKVYKMKKQELVDILAERILDKNYLISNIAAFEERMDYDKFFFGIEADDSVIALGYSQIGVSFMYDIGDGNVKSIIPDELANIINNLDINEVNLVKARYSLVFNYIRAFSNLYGVYEKNVLISTFNKQNEEAGVQPLTSEEFEYCLHKYNMFNEEVGFNGVEVIGSALCVSEDDYKKVVEGQKGKEYYIPAKEELLKYSNEYYIKKTQYYDDLYAYLMKVVNDKDIVNELMIAIYSNCVMDSFTIDLLLARLELLGVRYNNLGQAQELLALCIKFSNNTHKWINRGWTASDLSKHSSKPNSSVISTKVGRNDPCPCGSGKKYKKCCGR